MTPFFRESLPLILLAVLGLGFVGERVVARLLRPSIPLRARNDGIARLLAKVGWVVPVLAFGWAWSFFKEYEGSPIMVFGMWQLWWGMLVVVVLMVVGFTGVKRGCSINKEKGLTAWLVPVAWFGGLVFFYLNWIKFHANYIGEFLPPLVILGGVAIPEVWRRVTGSTEGKSGKLYRVLVVAVFTAVLGWALFVSGYVTYMYEHSGTFKQRALEEAAVWAQEHIPKNEYIFTGAAAVPYLSGHHTVLDIAHPRWYAYEFTRKDTTRLNTFLPPAEEMVEAFRQANWFLHERQTGFSFMMEYSEIEAGLESDFERMHGIENGSNTLTFYRRIKQ